MNSQKKFGVFILNNKRENVVAETEFFPSQELCPGIPISTPLTFPFQNNQVMMVLDKNNWWNPLGGHIEKNETWEEALIREALEEGGVDIADNLIFGYIKINRISGSNTYPSVTQIPMTQSVIIKYHYNWIKMETKDRRLFSIEEAIRVLSERGDNQQMLQIFSYMIKNKVNK